MTLNFWRRRALLGVHVQGLRQAGCDVYWLEQLPAKQPPRRAKVEAWLERLRGYGLGDKVILAAGAGGDRHYVTKDGSSADDVFASADLLLNFHYAMTPTCWPLPPHRPRGHRPGSAADVDERRPGARGAARRLPDHQGNRSGPPGAVPRLRPGVAPHSATGLARSLAVHVRPRLRGLHDGHRLVERVGPEFVDGRRCCTTTQAVAFLAFASSAG